MKLFNLVLAIFIIASAQAAEATKGEKHQAVVVVNNSIGRELGNELETELDSASNTKTDTSARDVIVMRNFIREMSPHR